jgi:hypothetical protein
LKACGSFGFSSVAFEVLEGFLVLLARLLLFLDAIGVLLRLRGFVLGLDSLLTMIETAVVRADGHLLRRHRAGRSHGRR